MSMFNHKVPPFHPQKDQELNWESFNGGWNNYSRPTELHPNELAQADNLMLVGTGTPTGRWGSVPYNLAGKGRIRLLDAYYNSNTSTNLLLSITDAGYLVQKTNASYTIIPGASFMSGTNFQSTQMGNFVYISSPSTNFIKFDGTTLIPYTSIGVPTNVSVAQLSSASGFNTWSWLITATSLAGETLGSVNKTLASLPLDLKQSSFKITWNTVSAAPSVLTGYNLYRGSPGNETYISSVDATATQYYDTGLPSSNTVFPPLVDTTGGPRAKYVLRVDDRIVLAGIPGDPSKILVSGRYPYNDRFSAIDGGGYCYVSPNDGDDITGLGLTHIQTTTPFIVVYKGRTTHVVTIGNVTLGNFSILDLQAQILTSSFGCSSGYTTISVENDYYAFGTKGLFSTGQEPQFLNQVRTNEISPRIRTYIQGLNATDFVEASAAYIDYKYLLSFATRKETIIYDRQRMAFMGPWKTPFGITRWFRYFDPSGTETWLAGCDDGYIRQFSSGTNTDNGTAINKLLRSRKEDLGTWNMFKILKYFYILFRNVRGQVTVNLILEQRNGNTVTAKTATITSQLGTSGWGTDQWGQIEWGTSKSTIVLSGDEIARYSQIFQQYRVLQVEVVANAANSNFELLSIRATSTSLGPSSLPSNLKI